MIDPRFLTIERWSALTCPILVPFGAPARPTDEAHWRTWADSIAGLPAMKGLQIPDSTWFKTWQEWAFRLNESLIVLGL